MGRLSVGERIELLLDSGSFIEVHKHIHSRVQFSDTQLAVGDGVITGYGTIDSRLVFIYCQDFSIYGGSLGEMHGKKIASIMDMAAKMGAPVIGLIDSGGARIQEGVLALDSYGQIFYRNVLYSGLIPQISVILGPCAGGAVYSPALTDFIFMVANHSQMFITGPKVIESITGEKVCRESLGGAYVHAHNSGVCHYMGDSEEDVITKVRQLLSYFPSQVTSCNKVILSQKDQHDQRRQENVPEEINHLLPKDFYKGYDMRPIIESIVDDGTFMEIQQHFAKNVVVGFARINNMVVSIVANQPKVLAGGIDVDASDKIARFVRFNDCFNIPIITLVDVPGFIPGSQQESMGIIRHGAKILYAYAEATVAKITVIVRKAYGGAYVALNSKGMGADVVYAWPNAEIAVMGHQSIKALKKEHSNEQNVKQMAGPLIAASLGMIDDIIEPGNTRTMLSQALLMLKNKKEDRPLKKHGNIPL